MLYFPRSIARVLRVLLMCLALASAMPATLATAQAELSATFAGLERSSNAAAVPRVANVRPHTYPTSYDKREPARVQSLPNTIRAQARCTFLLNCSLRC